MVIKVATANIAGAAREETADPCKCMILGSILSDADIIGLQEVVKVVRPDGSICRDDVKELQNGGLSGYESFFFPHLDSRQHSHPLKWEGDEKTRSAFRSYYAQGCHIQQGAAVLVKQPHRIYDLWRDRPGSALGQIIPWYLDAPTFYQGNRDTEPRSLLLARIRLKNKFVLFCCTQLTTLKEENQKVSGKTQRIPTPSAIGIRTNQINWIVQYIKNYRAARQEEEPIILVGDFNAKPTAQELQHLVSNLDLEGIFPEGDPATHRGYEIPIDLIYATKATLFGSARIVNLEDWETSSGKRISDHYPVIAEIGFR
jgi:endonuclease/exonuclease/phosphatase family metal-dependent hydrolase